MQNQYCANFNLFLRFFEPYMYGKVVQKVNIYGGFRQSVYAGTTHER